MNPPVRLSIPTPCHEKWSGFNPVPGGGFCSSCQKRVVDFTGLSDEKIISVISGSPGTVCGRFRPEQLNREYRVRDLARIRPGMSLAKAGVTALFLLLISKPTAAQERRSNAETEIVIDEQSPSKKETSVDGDESYWIEGVIRDKYDKSPMPGVNVILRGTTHGTATDANGVFRFPVKVKKGDVLIVSFIGFTTEEYKVPAATGAKVHINLAMDYDIMGEVAVEGMYCPKQTLWSRIRNLF